MDTMLGVWKEIRRGWEDFKRRTCFEVGYRRSVVLEEHLVQRYKIEHVFPCIVHCSHS